MHHSGPSQINPDSESENSEDEDSENFKDDPNSEPEDHTHLFNSCEEGMEMWANSPNEGLRKQLEIKCNFQTGGKVQKFIPLVGSLGKVGNFLGSLMKGQALAQRPEDGEQIVM